MGPEVEVMPPGPTAAVSAAAAAAAAAAPSMCVGGGNGKHPGGGIGIIIHGGSGGGGAPNMKCPGGGGGGESSPPAAAAALAAAAAGMTLCCWAAAVPAATRLGTEAEGVRRVLCLLLAGWIKPLHPRVKLEAALSGLRFAAAEVVPIVSPVDEEGVINMTSEGGEGSDGEREGRTREAIAAGCRFGKYGRGECSARDVTGWHVTDCQAREALSEMPLDARFIYLVSSHSP